MNLYQQRWTSVGRGITLLKIFHIVKAMFFPAVMYRCECWTMKDEHQRIDAFKLWCWRRLLRVPWTIRRSSQSILKEINPEYSLEGLMLKLKLHYFGHLIRLIGKDPDVGKDWRQKDKAMTGDEMVGWYHQLNGHEYERTPGDGEGQGSLACCSPWGHKELDTTATKQCLVCARPHTECFTWTITFNPHKPIL